MKKLLASPLIFILFIGSCSNNSSYGQNIASPPSYKTEGLELPKDQIVAPDEGFVLVTAITKGTVKWLALGTVKFKFAINSNTIIISVPSTPGAVVSVFAVALVDGKLTDFARTNIQVSAPPPQPPGPDPPLDPKPPAPISGRLHLTVVEDVSQRTSETATLFSSQTLRKSLSDQGHILRIYDIKDPVIQAKKMNTVINGLTLPVLVIQTDDGKVHPQGKAIPLPKTEQEFLDLIKTLTRK